MLLSSRIKFCSKSAEKHRLCLFSCTAQCAGEAEPRFHPDLMQLLLWGKQVISMQCPFLFRSLNPSCSNSGLQMWFLFLLANSPVVPNYLIIHINWLVFRCLWLVGRCQVSVSVQGQERHSHTDAMQSVHFIALLAWLYTFFISVHAITLIQIGNRHKSRAVHTPHIPLWLVTMH